MTIKLREANTGKTMTTYENVAHIQVCSTGPRPNTRTMLLSHRHDGDDEFIVTLDENTFICLDD